MNSSFVNKIILIYSFFSILIVSCNQKTTLDLVNEFYQNNKNKNIDKYKGWKIYPRTNGSNPTIFGFEYYYEHKDSSRFSYLDDGRVFEQSKYSTLQFVVEHKNNEAPHLITNYRDIDKQMNIYADALKISPEEAKVKLDEIINGFFSLQTKYLLSTPWSYPAISMYLNDSLSVCYAPLGLEKINLPEPDIKFYQLENKWFYVIEPSN